MIHTLNELMEETFNPLLAQFQHFLEDIALEVPDDFDRLSKMGFTRETSKKGEGTISVKTGLTLLTALLINTSIMTFQGIISLLPLALARIPMIGLGMKLLLKGILMFHNFGTHNGGTVANNGDVDIGNGIFYLKMGLVGNDRDGGLTRLTRFSSDGVR